MLKIGSVLEDRYRIGQKIGDGGSGSVYLAIQKRTGRKLAVKEIDKNRQDPQGLKRTLELLKELKDPGLPLVMDILETGESFLIIMEYVEGENLQELIDRRKEEGSQFSGEEVCRIGIGICGILEYLHSMPVPLIYRDLKPSNILIREDGSLSLVDLGTICVSGSGSTQTTAVGTPGFAAPEQYVPGEVIGPEADIYSLGASLHYLLTGSEPYRNPFYFQKVSETTIWRKRKVGKKEWRRILGLEAIIASCTSYKKERRYSRIREVRKALEAAEQGIKKKSRSILLPGLFLVLALAAGIVSYQSWKTGTRMKEEGTKWCLSKARHSEYETALEWIGSAMQMTPGSPETFSLLLDLVLQDGIFTEKEQEDVRTLLDRTMEGEQMDNETLFRQEAGAFLHFSYRMGTAYYYSVDGIPDYEAAYRWLEEVGETGERWTPLTEKGEEEKNLLMKRAEILARICSYRGQELKTGMLTATDGKTLKDYWEDLTELLQEDIPGGLLLQTEAGLWKEITGLVFNWTCELAAEGISADEQIKIVEQIASLTGNMLSGQEAKEYQQIRQLLEEVADTAETAIHKVDLTKNK